MKAFRKKAELLFLALTILATNVLINATPLDDYVNEPDPYTGYEVLKSYDSEAYTGYILNFTSQKWFDETVSDKPVWWHYLSIVIPKVLKRADIGSVLLSGGSNHHE